MFSLHVEFCVGAHPELFQSELDSIYLLSEVFPAAH